LFIGFIGTVFDGCNQKTGGMKIMKKLVLVVVTAVLLSLLVIPVNAAEEEVVNLEEVVVTASRYEEDIMETAVSIEVIDEEEIEESAANNIAELIEFVAGTQINAQGGPAGQKTISLRGSSASQVLILLDGQPINSSQNGQVDLGQILLSNVKKVEILKGPASALYGANALGGVVNIITKKGSDIEGLNLDLSIGSADTYKTAINYGTVLERAEVQVTAETLNSDGFREDIDNSGIDQYFLSTKINYDLNKNNELVFDFSYNDSDKEVPGPLTDPSPNAIQDDKMENYKISYLNSKDNRDSNISVYYSDQENIYDNPDKSGYTGPSEHNTKKKGLTLNQTHYFNKNTFSYGLEYVEDKIDSNENGKHNFDTKSLYLNDKWNINNKLNINAGIRYDDHEKFGSESSPRVGLTYDVNQNNNIYLSAGKSYRTPTFNDLYWPASIYMEGNTDLEAETSTAYEIGFRSSYNDFNSEINIFRRNSDNLITWDAGNDLIWRPYNVNEAETDGLELSLNTNITNNITLDYSHTYLDSRNVATDKLLKDQYYNDISLSYKPEKYSIIFKASHVGGRINGLDEYTVCDLTFTKPLKIAKRNYDIKLSINNLFDEEYEVVSGPNSPKDYPMPERNYMLTLSTKF